MMMTLCVRAHPDFVPDELFRRLLLDGVLQTLGALVVGPAEELRTEPEVRSFSP